MTGLKKEIIGNFIQIIIFYPKKISNSSSPCYELHSIPNGIKAYLQNNIKEGC